VKPFSIQCESCLARLKVTKASLIGKRLPCPKCSSFVLVPDPAKLAENEPTADQAGASDPREKTATVSTESLGGFEDVDAVLSQLPATPKRQPKSQEKKRPKPTSEKTNTPESTPEPINPDLSWDNPAAVNTRRTLAWAAAAIGIILFAAIGIYAWTQLASTDAGVEKLAQAGLNSGETPPPTPTNSKTSKSNPTDNDNGALKPADPDTNEAPSIEPTATEIEEPTNEPPIVSSAPPPIDVVPPTLPPRSGNGLSVTSPVTRPDPANGNTAADTTPVPPNIPSANDEILRPVAQASSALNELSSLLEQSGSSISAITDATASVAAADTIGLPKYYFQTSRSALGDLERQLDEPCAGLSYDDVSIIEILRDITVISGIPISIDSASLLGPSGSDNKRLIPNVTVKVVDTNFREAIETIASQAGWTATVSEIGILLTEPDAGKPSTKTINLAPIAELGEQGLDGVVNAIKTMIAADSWFSEAQQYQIERNGMTLTVQHEPAVTQQIERFIQKISAATQLASPNIANKESLENSLKTRLSRAATNLTTSCELAIGSRSTLDNLLNRIRKKTNVDVIANWHTLSALEWTPLMTVPGNVSEPTMAEMLRQLERSTDSTAIVLDASTVELTHPVDALERRYVEFYLIPDLFERNFTPQRAIQLIQEAIENAGQPAGLTVYEPRCQCIILAAPQSTHRVVEAVLLEVRQLN